MMMIIDDYDNNDDYGNNDYDDNDDDDDDADDDDDDNTDRALVRLFLRVHAHMDKELVSRVEGPRAWTSLPEAGEFVLAGGRRGREEPLASILALLVPFPLHPPAMAVRVRRRRLDVPPLDVSH